MIPAPTIESVVGKVMAMMAKQLKMLPYLFRRKMHFAHENLRPLRKSISRSNVMMYSNTTSAAAFG